MSDTQSSFELFKILSQFSIEPEIIAKFSQLTPTMPKLLAGKQLNVRLFFEGDCTSLVMPFEQVMQLNAVFVPFRPKKSLMVKVFAAGYYNLYDTLVAANVGKLSDAELPKKCLWGFL
jgi:hypothetical protein